MTFSAPTLLVTLVFLAQILVISVLVPYQFHKAYSSLKERYPPNAYSRLYPVAPGRDARFNAILAVVRLVVVLGSTALFAVDLAEGHDAAALARTMILITLAQLVPAFVWLTWQQRIARAFRAMPAPSVRSAELRPSRVADFVPLPLVAAGIAGSAACMVSTVVLYASDPSGASVGVLFMLAASSWLLVRIFMALRAPGSTPRPDPYMTDADVFRTRQQRLRVLFSVAAGLGVWFTVIVLIKVGMLPVSVVAICICCSILSQLTYLRTARVVLRTLAARDASVYRTEAI